MRHQRYFPQDIVGINHKSCHKNLMVKTPQNNTPVLRGGLVFLKVAKCTKAIKYHYVLHYLVHFFRGVPT
jgi:hypothetical protein